MFSLSLNSYTLLLFSHVVGILYNKYLISCRINHIVILAFKIGTSFKSRIKLCQLFALCLCSVALPRPKSKLMESLSHQNHINQLFHYSFPWLVILLSYQNCEVFNKVIIRTLLHQKLKILFFETIPYDSLVKLWSGAYQTHSFIFILTFLIFV
jgi:hypothetical protein